MEIYNGIDIVDIARIEQAIEKHGDSFIKKCYTDCEQSYCNARSALSVRYASYAARFAAKEACGKAIGTGVMSNGVGMLDIEVTADDSGKPTLKLYGKAKEKAETMGITSIAVSLSHDGGIATASVVMLGGECR